MTTLGVIETLQGYAAARSAGHARLATDNPLLAADSRVADVQNLEARIDQDLANHLGMAGIRLALAVDEVLQASDWPARLGIAPEHLQLAGGLCRLASGLLHRAAVMALAQKAEAFTRLSLYPCAAPRFVASDPLSPPRFACPFPELAERGFFGSSAVDVHPDQEGPRLDVTSEVPAGRLQRFVHLPASTIAFELAERLRLTRLPRGRRLVVGHENETLRETLPWLAAKGYRLQRGVRLQEPWPNNAPEIDAAAVAEVHGVLSAALATHIGGCGVFDDTQQCALAGLLVDRIARTLTGLVASVRGQRQRIAKIFGNGGVLLTGGLFGAKGALLYGLLREAGVTVIEFEHGVTTGLSAHSQAKIWFSEASTCDVSILCAENAAWGFSEAARSESVIRIPVGLSDQTRRLLRPGLQRHLARRSLRIAPDETTIMHVSTWLYSSNMRPGYGTPSETAVFELDRRLVTEVYGRLLYRVVFKPYPTQRFPHHLGVEELHGRPANLTYAPNEDLRYVRAAADVFVTGSPTSTMGWILGTDKPVVWLESRKMNPIIEAWRERLLESMLWVDIDQPDWTEKLRELLARPVADLQRIWYERAPLRARFLAEAVSGPEGITGRRAAQEIIKVIGSDLSGSISRSSAESTLSSHRTAP